MNLILLQRVIFQIYKNKEEAAYASLAKFLFVADAKKHDLKSGVEVEL